MYYSWSHINLVYLRIICSSVLTLLTLTSYDISEKSYPYRLEQQISHPFWMTSSHSFHSLEAKKGPISFTFGHTQTSMVNTKSPPPPGYSFTKKEMHSIISNSLTMSHSDIVVSWDIIGIQTHPRCPHVEYDTAKKIISELASSNYLEQGAFFVRGKSSLLVIEVEYRLAVICVFL